MGQPSCKNNHVGLTVCECLVWDPARVKMQ